MLEAYFVAVVQILVYAGAIMVLFLFVIMLLDLRSRGSLARHRGPGLPKFGVLAAGGCSSPWPVALIEAPPGRVLAPGAGRSRRRAPADRRWIFNRWLLAFEVTSILLLGAILGAVILTKRRLT